MRSIFIALTLFLIFTPGHAADKTRQVAQEWAFQESDIPLDPAFLLGRLDNGLRYIIRANDRPEGTALVRMRIGSGSLSERDDERGLAHFIEHMAFNGSKHVPEGEMVKLLEREGLAFGADTNASTGFEATSYRLDLPRNDPALLDTALMLMRETASELLLDPEAIDRERGVILAERRDRRNYQQRETEDRLAFLTPGARYLERFPIGLPEVLETASASQFRAYYEREYVPANTVIIVIGDFDTAQVEKAIRARFADWSAAPLPQLPKVGPIDFEGRGRTAIYIDPSLSERVSISRVGPPIIENDTAATRRQNLLVRMGYGAINRRLQRLALGKDAPFRSAGFGTGKIFDDGRTTNLIVDSADGGWKAGLEAAASTLRSALNFGFSEAEIQEQVAAMRTAQENAVSTARTRSNANLVNAATSLVADEIVPSTPQSSLARFKQFEPYVTPAAVLAAVRQDAIWLDQPLIRFRGRFAPEGGDEALRAAWNAISARDIVEPERRVSKRFAYTDFGPPGQIVDDRMDARIGARMVRFSNGVMLNLKQTELTKDRISFRMRVDGGELLNTKENPLATALVTAFTAGGLGKHSIDELQTILAGKNARFSLRSGGDTFTSSGTTTNRDLELQLQLLAAMLSDPGYRPEAVSRFRRNVTNYFKRLDATPGDALGSGIGRILSDGDPRFSLADEAALKQRTFAMLDHDIGKALRSGALEIALVGDFDPDRAIALVGETLGALAPRERTFRPRTTARVRAFTQDRSNRILRHKGEPDQALLRLTWPTRDDSDLREAQQLALLERVTRLSLQAQLRERLGKAYSPSARNALSGVYTGYGTFSITASIDVADIDETRRAIGAVVDGLRSAPANPDIMERARKPLLEAYDNALKSNGSWLGLIDRAQSHPEDIDRFLKAKSVVEGITAADLQQAAQKYLAPGLGLEVLVLPTDVPQ